MRTPDSWNTTRATVGIALITAFAYLVVSVFGVEGWAIDFGSFVPASLGFAFPFPRAPFVLTPLTATLLHVSLWHLLFNLIMHLFCGRAVERALGPVNLIILYIVGAFAAAGAQFALDPQSLVPIIGASGAISAIVGAYSMLFGRNRVKVADARLALWLNVAWLLAAWIVLQMAMGIVFGQNGGTSLAVGAHIGGFIAGVILARPLLLWRYRHA